MCVWKGLLSLTRRLANGEIRADRNLPGPTIRKHRRGNKQGEEEEVEERRKVESELISNNVALIHLLKGNIGIGVMAMPRSEYVDEHDTNDIDSEKHLISLENMNDIETVTSQEIIK